MRTAIYAVWAVFWIGWLLAAFGNKRGAGSHAGRVGRIGVAAVAVAVLHLFHPRALEVHSTALRVTGTVLFAVGLGLAVWARVALGRNWGTPMSLKQEPELVTSGPYRSVRHPIYSGILLGLLGTGLATDTYWLFVLAVMAAYFVCSAAVEERLMAAAFPDAYPSYRQRTKMLIPFVV